MGLARPPFFAATSLRYCFRVRFSIAKGHRESRGAARVRQIFSRLSLVPARLQAGFEDESHAGKDMRKPVHSGKMSIHACLAMRLFTECGQFQTIAAGKCVTSNHEVR